MSPLPCHALCLSALNVAQLPGGVVVDVYTTHLSLSERARERTVVEVWDFIQDSRVGHMQVQ